MYKHPALQDVQSEQARFDIGTISEIFCTQEITKLVQLGHLLHPEVVGKFAIFVIFQLKTVITVKLKIFQLLIFLL